MKDFIKAFAVLAAFGCAAYGAFMIARRFCGKFRRSYMTVD